MRRNSINAGAEYATAATTWFLLRTWMLAPPLIMWIQVGRRGEGCKKIFCKRAYDERTKE
jgi:hypothetical protein